MRSNNKEGKRDEAGKIKELSRTEPILKPHDIPNFYPKSVTNVQDQILNIPNSTHNTQGMELEGSEHAVSKTQLVAKQSTSRAVVLKLAKTQLVK